MNRNSSTRISQGEIISLLPEWFDQNYHLTFQLLQTNAYSSLAAIKTFLMAALSDIACSEEERERTPIKHVKVKVQDKGLRDGYQYVTVDVYVVMQDGPVYRVAKSCKVKIRTKMQKD